MFYTITQQIHFKVVTANGYYTTFFSNDTMYLIKIAS